MVLSITRGTGDEYKSIPAVGAASVDAHRGEVFTSESGQAVVHIANFYIVVPLHL